MSHKTRPGASRRKAPSPEPVLVSAKPDGRVDFNNAQRRDAMIAEAAYYRAARRGFVPGHELDDWLAAEQQVDTALFTGETPLS
jgi:hypothetical protein